MKILFLTPYPTGYAPSQRFRFEQYYRLLLEKEITYDVQSFLDEEAWRILYKQGFIFDKVLGVIRGFARRIEMLFRARKYEYVFIHREASPIGPPVFEWILACWLKKRVIYDFDDAIWLPNTSATNRLAARLKWHSKVGAICGWSYKVSCGNAYLCEFANQFNGNVILNPTTIDTEGLHIRSFDPQVQDIRVNSEPAIIGATHQNVIIGWTGTHSTLHYLQPLVPLLKRLYKNIKFELVVISNQEPSFHCPFLTFIPWKKNSEIEDLQRFDIGVMPLTDDPWAKGKCGFKALQYMALGIPALGSPIGVNSKIIDSGINGFLCQSEEEWSRNLKLLLENAHLRQKMGQAGRRKVEQKYSVKSNSPNFLSLYD